MFVFELFSKHSDNRSLRQVAAVMSTGSFGRCCRFHVVNIHSARQPSQLCLRPLYFGNAHGHRCHSADYVPIGWITNVTDLPPRLWARNQNQLLSIEFTPTAGITVSEFDE